MKKEPQWDWPEIIFYELYGEDANNHRTEVPKDFDLCLEFVLRNMFSREYADYIRERFEKNLTLKAIAGIHGVSVEVARNRIRLALRTLRHPSRSKYLARGMLEGLKTEISIARSRAYNSGYKVGYEEGYQKCRSAFLTRELTLKKRLVRIREELPQYVEELDLTSRTKNLLDRVGITKVETLLMLSKIQLRGIRGVGRDISEEIITTAEKLGFPLVEGIPSEFV